MQICPTLVGRKQTDRYGFFLTDRYRPVPNVTYRLTHISMRMGVGMMPPWSYPNAWWDAYTIHRNVTMIRSVFLARRIVSHSVCAMYGVCTDGGAAGWSDATNRWNGSSPDGRVESTVRLGVVVVWSWAVEWPVVES